MGSLGDRMKANYERPARRYFTRRMPLIIRVDGRAFHTWTRGLEKPFDKRLIASMQAAANRLALDMQGFKAAYIQSDEVSFLLTDYDQLTTEAWFDYCQSKVESVAASMMTARFNEFWTDRQPATFDARAFNIPREEVANYFLWRAKDWERNSVSMYCRSFFSHKQMHGQGRADQHEMLHGIGKNWTTDLSDRERNGTWLLSVGRGTVSRHDVLPTFPEIDAALSPLIYPESTEERG